MITLAPTELSGHGVTLDPLNESHASGLREAAADGNLWELWFTAVPEPDKVDTYIQAALEGQRAGHMLPWVVRELTSLGLGEAKAVVDGAPKAVLEGANKETAEKAKAQLEVMEPILALLREGKPGRVFKPATPEQAEIVRQLGLVQGHGTPRPPSA